MVDRQRGVSYHFVERRIGNGPILATRRTSFCSGGGVAREPDAPAQFSVPRRPLAWSLLISLRPRQWTKNGLLFLGLIFSLSLYDHGLVLRTLLAFVDFCVLASSTYLINDVLDLERDRLHPIKRNRPVASGQVAPITALLVSAMLLVIGLAMAGSLGAGFTIAALLYLLITITYSLWLKNIAIVDLLVVAAGFVLRAGAGAVVIGVPISPWLYVCTMLGALFLATSKRRHEMVLLRDVASEHRRILQAYTVPFLDQMISVLASASVIAYSLYTFSAENLPKNQAMMLTIPFVLYGVFRYLYLIHTKGGGGTPEEALLTDKPLLATVLGWGAASTAIIYLFR